MQPPGRKFFLFQPADLFVEVLLRDRTQPSHPRSLRKYDPNNVWQLDHALACCSCAWIIHVGGSPTVKPLIGSRTIGARADQRFGNSMRDLQVTPSQTGR